MTIIHDSLPSRPYEIMHKTKSSSTQVSVENTHCVSASSKADNARAGRLYQMAVNTVTAINNYGYQMISELHTELSCTLMSAQL